MWGVLDLLAIAWYVGWNIYYKRFPIFHDVKMIVDNATSFGVPALKYLFIFGILIYLSLIISGVYLIKLNKKGAIISYCQTPFRLLMVIPPSVFFILWPIKYIVDPPQIVAGICLVLLSEIFKMSCVVSWHRKLLKA